MKKICCFAGHSKIYENGIYEKLKVEIENLIKTENISEFWVGNYGQFDKMCAGCVRELKSLYPITLNLVIPYTTKEMDSNKKDYYNKFDNIIMADIKDNTPMKLKILKGNEYMVNNSTHIICYVKFSFGGAIKTLEYAKRKNKIIINI